MKYQLLPHYFKFIGLALYLIAMLPDGIPSFIQGFNSGLEGYEGPTMYVLDDRMLFGIFIPKSLIVLFNTISIIGIIIYALSKDKVFDEFMQKLRFESIQIVFFLSVLVILLMYIINPDIRFDAYNLLQIQLIAFLIIHKFRKVKFEAIYAA